MTRPRMRVWSASPAAGRQGPSAPSAGAADRHGVWVREWVSRSVRLPPHHHQLSTSLFGENTGRGSEREPASFRGNSYRPTDIAPLSEVQARNPRKLAVLSRISTE